MNPEAGWIGLVSDTHGLLRPEALAALRGAERIIHAGDIGRDQGILDRLAAVAPLTVVRGNVDTGDGVGELPATATVRWRAALVYVIHDLTEIDVDPAAAGIAAVISGHSHRPEVFRRDGVLYLNPGSAGPRRFRLPVTVARLWRGRDGVVPEIVTLAV